MATLGTMRTRIARELQIDASTYATEIDAAIFSAIQQHEDADFWFLEAAPATLTLTSTVQYPLTTALPGRSQIKAISVNINGCRDELILRTLDEYLELDFSDNYSGNPVYYTVDHDNLLISPKPNGSFSAQVWYTTRLSLTASASASSAWTTEAEELIRLEAEVDLLENRIKDFEEALRKRPRLMQALRRLHEKTVMRRPSSRRIKPWL